MATAWTFLSTLAWTTGLMLALAIPLFVVTRRRKLRATTKRFLVSAGVIGVVSAFLAASSEHIIRQCHEAGNTACFDSGAPGLILISIVGYTLVAWIRARRLADW